MIDMDLEELAEKITHQVMSSGGYESDRIQFMVGTYPDCEKNYGGLCRDALYRRVLMVLDEVSLSGS